MIGIILTIFGLMLCLMLFAALVVMCFEGTETFMAIDEKIARFIKGEDDDVFDNDYYIVFLEKGADDE